MPTEPTEAGSWSSYERLVLSELKRLDERIGCIDRKLDVARLEVASLKVKAGVWGFAAGAIPAIAALLLMLLRSRL